MKPKTLLPLVLLLLALVGILFTYAEKGDARADNIVTILHCNDTHSFWYPHDRRDWGGFARMATKIKQLKAEILSAHPDRTIITMVAGDVIEGRFFSRCEGGACDLQLMDAMGIDYWVIGNHDWLIGPSNQYFVLAKAQPQLTILSCNVRYTRYNSGADIYRDLPPEFALEQYIRPYDTVMVNGTKIGIVGISTYDYIYDAFYFPVTLEAPSTALPDAVSDMQNEGCEFIIGLSHLGRSADNDLFGTICPGDGLNVIVGGHSHTKMLSTDTPSCPSFDSEIVQAWAHGKLLGQIDIDTTDVSNPIHNYVLHQIDSTIPEDQTVAAMIDAFTAQIIAENNIPDNDNILKMDVDLHKGATETKLANVICDAYLWKLHQQGFSDVDLTMFNSEYLGDHLERSTLLPSPEENYSYFSSLDLYNVIPHTYDPGRGVSWLLYSYEISGAELKLVMGQFLNFAYTNVSGNCEIVYDPSKKSDDERPVDFREQNDSNFDSRGVDSFKINGEEIVWYHFYTFAVDEGIKSILDQLGFHYKYVTNIEAWKAFRDYVQTQEPLIRRGINSAIDGRVRTVQPDVAVFEDSITPSFWSTSVGTLIDLTAVVRNWGTQNATSGTLSFYYDKTPQNFVDDPSYQQIGATQSFSNLNPYPLAEIQKSVMWNTTGLSPGLYPIYVAVGSVPGEYNHENNTAQSFIELK